MAGLGTSGPIRRETGYSRALPYSPLSPRSSSGSTNSCLKKMFKDLATDLGEPDYYGKPKFVPVTLAPRVTPGGNGGTGGPSGPTPAWAGTPPHTNYTFCFYTYTPRNVCVYGTADLNGRTHGLGIFMPQA